MEYDGGCARRRAIAAIDRRGLHRGVEVDAANGGVVGESADLGGRKLGDRSSEKARAADHPATGAAYTALGSLSAALTLRGRVSSGLDDDRDQAQFRGSLKPLRDFVVDVS